MLTIFVGETNLEVEMNLPIPEFRRLPSELVKDFDGWYDEDKDQKVRTFTDTLINYIGELIEDGTINNENVQIVVDGRMYYYHNDGTILGWPYGYFNY